MMINQNRTNTENCLFNITLKSRLLLYREAIGWLVILLMFLKYEMKTFVLKDNAKQKEKYFLI